MWTLKNLLFKNVHIQEQLAYIRVRGSLVFISNWLQVPKRYCKTSTELYMASPTEHAIAGDENIYVYKSYILCNSKTVIIQSF
jgi:hypothetical protein